MAARLCSSCSRQVPRAQFSQVQWRKQASERRCGECVSKTSTCPAPAAKAASGGAEGGANIQTTSLPDALAPLSPSAGDEAVGVILAEMDVASGSGAKNSMYNKIASGQKCGQNCMMSLVRAEKNTQDGSQRSSNFSALMGSDSDSD